MQEEKNCKMNPLGTFDRNECVALANCSSLAKVASAQGRNFFRTCHGQTQTRLKVTKQPSSPSLHCSAGIVPILQHPGLSHGCVTLTPVISVASHVANSCRFFIQCQGSKHCVEPHCGYEISDDRKVVVEKVVWYGLN